MFLFSVDLSFILLHGTKHFLSVASHSNITHSLIKCFTLSLLWPSMALKHRTAQKYTPSVIVCWEISCSVLFFFLFVCLHEISGSQIATMFRIAHFSRTVSAIYSMYTVHNMQMFWTFAKMCSIRPKHCAWHGFFRKTNEQEVIPCAF